MVEDGDIKPIVDLIYSFEVGISMYIWLPAGRKVIISLSKWILKSKLTLKTFVAKIKDKCL
jgi:hypothetical protein